MYNLDFVANRSRAMSFVFKSKIVILYLTGSKRVNSRCASTPYAGFLAGGEEWKPRPCTLARRAWRGRKIPRQRWIYTVAFGGEAGKRTSHRVAPSHRAWCMIRQSGITPG
jgi:hypothetical protein